jgi:hypothetical protein
VPRLHPLPLLLPHEVNRHAGDMLPLAPSDPHDDGMSRLPRAAALQVGEFAVGVVVAYAAVVAAWAVSASAWSIGTAAAVVAAAAVAIELRFGRRVAGLVAGLLPTALLTGGLLISLSLVLYRLN